MTLALGNLPKMKMRCDARFVFFFLNLLDP
jgi:hypothetical protein